MARVDVGPGPAPSCARSERENSPAPINTDRPALTDSSVVVPELSLQIKNGFLETITLGQQSLYFAKLCCASPHPITTGVPAQDLRWTNSGNVVGYPPRFSEDGLPCAALVRVLVRHLQRSSGMSAPSPDSP